jgi:biopolymer transport protein ExbD
MKFPRNARIFHGQFDVAPFAGVFFLLALFLLLGSLVYTPGVSLTLPAASDLPGTDKSVVSVAVDASGQFYFDNQLIPEAQLKARLASVVRKSAEPLTLLVQADISVKYETLIHLALIARRAGLQEAFLATRPQNPLIAIEEEQP